MQTVTLTVPLNTTQEELRAMALRRAGIASRALKTYEVLRRSVDARHKDSIKFVYNIALSTEKEELPTYAPPRGLTSAMRPVVVGFGPAGMLCALVLAEAGLCPIVLERGAPVEERTQRVERFWREGVLDTRTNVQFGEGGAGTFSDGKLTTGTGDKPLQRYVLKQFVAYGASPSIMYDAKPHVGTDKLKGLVKGIRERIESLGGKVCCHTKLTDLRFLPDGVVACTDKGEYKTSHLVLAVGHSARDTYHMLESRGFVMESKPFAVGVRCEHLQADINRAMYGEYATSPYLGPADYKLVAHTKHGGVYSFCMCPGGHVVASSSEEGSIVTNGMSYSDRGGVNANSALLVGIDASTYGSALFDGVAFQESLEKRAYQLGGGGYRAPVQLLGDFVAGRPSASFGRVQPTYRPGVTMARLDEGLPIDVALAMKDAVGVFGQKIKGFDANDTLFTGYETRSSAPIRVLRGDDMQSVSSPYVYPCGEGCGYAGGIMSAATDGIKVAEAICRSIARK